MKMGLQLLMNVTLGYVQEVNICHRMLNLMSFH